MSELVFRPVTVIEFPWARRTRRFEANKIVLSLRGGRNFDFGALCYSSRKHVPFSRSKLNSLPPGKKVDLDSFEKTRMDVVARLLEVTFDMLESGDVRITTASTRLREGVCAVFQWADSNG